MKICREQELVASFTAMEREMAKTRPRKAVEENLVNEAARPDPSVADLVKCCGCGQVQGAARLLGLSELWAANTM